MRPLIELSRAELRDPQVFLMSEQADKQIDAYACGSEPVLSLSCLSLSAFPVRIASLHTLESLDISKNNLRELPACVGSLTALLNLDASRNEIASIAGAIGNLKKLKFLNVMCNKLTTLPDEICALTSLYRLGVKSNRLKELPAEFGNLVNLVELFLTDNCLTRFPDSLQHCTALVKLQAAHNELHELPDCFDSLSRLELVRVPINNLKSLPPSLWRSPSLAWFSLASNPISPDAPPPTHTITTISASDISAGEKLGDGASGEVFRASWQGKEYAVKKFAADDTSPDGHARDEIAVKLFVDHPCLTVVRARIEAPPSLLMDVVSGKPMAEKPNLQSLLRCRWAKDTTFSTQRAVIAAKCTADALAYLHGNCIAHGDVYAHNMLEDPHGRTVLCDYGAAFFYHPDERRLWEPVEVRAWGLFLKDVHSRLAAPTNGDSPAAEVLARLVQDCLLPTPQDRPTFSKLAGQLDALMSSHQSA